VDSKECELCAKPYSRPKGRKDSAWEAQRFCSKSCALRSRPKNPATKKIKCELCGTVFEVKWRSLRRFCKGTCQRLAQGERSNRNIRLSLQALTYITAFDRWLADPSTTNAAAKDAALLRLLRGTQ
jgi:hypothetical protein